MAKIYKPTGVVGGKFVHVDSTLLFLAIEKQQKNIKTVTDRALSKKTTELWRKAKSNVARGKSGRTRESVIKDRLAPRQYIVGSKYSVARFLEFGTKNMTAQPWLMPAVLEVGPTVAPYVLEEVGRSWTGSGKISLTDKAGIGASRDFNELGTGR